MRKPGDAPGKLTDLPNIGKTTAAKLEKIGIKSKEDFLKRDPYDVFHALRAQVDPTLCRCALAGLVGAKKGKPWHLVTKASAREYEKRHPRHTWGRAEGGRIRNARRSIQTAGRGAIPA